MELENITDEELEVMIKETKSEKGLSDLFFLNHNILGHDKMTKRTHGELCKLANEWRDKSSLYLLPRGTFKTNLITEGLAIQEILKNPDIRIFVFCETYTKAVKYTAAIREHLESQPIEELYGVQKNEKCWREEGFRVAGRTILAKEDTVTPGGIDKPATGMHFDIIICDDLLGETNTNTVEQLEKSKKRFEELYCLLEPNGIIVIVGTIWDKDDLYCDIITKQEGINNWEDLLKKKVHIGVDWNIYIRRAKDPDGTYFFPERLGQASLDSLKRKQTTYKFMTQYYNDPTQRTNSVFDMEWLEKAKENWKSLARESTGKPVVSKKILLVDPAVSKNPDADYSALIVLGVNSNSWVVMEAYQDRLDARELIDCIFSLVNQYRIKTVVLETIGFQKVIAQWVKEEKPKRSTYFKLVEFNPGTKRDKESRIESLVPRFRQGLISYSEDFVELDAQLRKFPSLSSRDKDDLIDCLSIGEQVKIESNLPFDPENAIENVCVLANSTGY